jgi:2-C-methyl-D-erythritol 4-phosphate cytidylyltransferase
MPKKYAIIVAGGSGSRMQSEIPKQYLMLGQKPVLVHTIEKFLAIDGINIILVLPSDSINIWNSIKEQYFGGYENIETAIGGKTRFQSVKSGLSKIKGNQGLVAVHDAVRPFVTTAIINQSFETAKNLGSAVVSVHSKDSVRLMKGDSNQSVDRNDVRLIQTPQTFDLTLLLDAYNVAEQDIFTDDASVFEIAGNKIFLINGDYKNIKITTPEDLKIGELLLINN